ncbi:hypothetical protein yc1106_05883 [Curvularia clavata]|uniref:HTH CENPB-type domain-containing protein n=1 Tax=Curvularia clavata TaxID=95742 RepID=A0A9Q9DUA5_CURCL|nr:hypothetical protein yc1106_05883 [Curvularia clavata]
MDPKELAIQNAIADLNSGIFTSRRKAAKWYGISKSTIRGRQQGQQPHATAHQQQQRLTPEQETFLVDWILDEDSRAQPPSHLRVREMATRILHMNSDYEPLRQLWVPHFIARNPRVASIVGRKIESAHTTSANYKTVKAFLKLFKHETGVALEVYTNARVLASSSKKKAYIKSPEDREWVSIIKTISATGAKLQCLVVFKGKHLQTT